MSTKRTVSVAVVVAITALWWANQAIAGQSDPALPSSSAAPASRLPAVSTGHTTALELEKLLGQVDVVDERTRTAGYDRDCGQGSACVFGPAWTDDHPGPGGHNGCDTRNDVLRRDLVDLEVRPGTNDCVVVAGTLADPYTGQRLTFTKAEAHAVQIDHIFPLAAAWDLGASTWSPERRVEFANDQDNLLAVDGPANASKGDQTPGEWLPIRRGGVCDYLARYLKVADEYDLPITVADVEAVQAAAPTCVSPAPGKVHP